MNNDFLLVENNFVPTPALTSTFAKIGNLLNTNEQQAA